MGVGMIFAALGGVYGGFTTIWSSQGAVTVPGLWANLITRYKGSCIFHADDSDAIARRLPRSQDCGVQLPI